MDRFGSKFFIQYPRPINKNNRKVNEKKQNTYSTKKKKKKLEHLNRIHWKSPNRKSKPFMWFFLDSNSVCISFTLFLIISQRLIPYFIELKICFVRTNLETINFLGSITSSIKKANMIFFYIFRPFLHIQH